jgi:hypothetical protein
MLIPASASCFAIRSAFALMGAFFLLFGDVRQSFRSPGLNIDLFLEYGLMVIADGALQQLVELSARPIQHGVLRVSVSASASTLVIDTVTRRFGPRR